MDGQPQDAGVVDEVARQRAKRAARRHEREDLETEAPETEGTVELLMSRSPRQQRFKTLAELEALLLTD